MSQPTQPILLCARTSTLKQEKGLESQIDMLDYALETHFPEYHPVEPPLEQTTFWEEAGVETDDLRIMKKHGGRVWCSEGTSGASFHEHPVYLAMLSFARENGIKNVLFEHSDRHSRDTEMLLAENRKMKKDGITFHYLNYMGTDLSTPAGRLALIVGAGIAEYTRLDLKIKTKRGMLSLEKKGIWAGKPPYGFRVITKKEDKENYGKLIYNVEEMRFIVELIQRLHARPHSTYRDLAKWANDEMYRTRRGKRWTAAGIRRIVAFSLYWTGEPEEQTGKFILQEMKENPELDGCGRCRWED